MKYCTLYSNCNKFKSLSKDTFNPSILSLKDRIGFDRLYIKNRSEEKKDDENIV